MKSNKLFLLLFLALAIGIYSFQRQKEGVVFYHPSTFPKTTYDFKHNPLSADGFELGRSLFYDPVLSMDSSISCAACHLQFSGFTHIDHSVSHGVEGRIGTRNAPVLINLAWSKSFHWDGGVPSLEAQAINPLTAHAEMDIPLPEVLKRLNADLYYKTAFEKVYHVKEIKTTHLLKALAQFTVSLVSANAQYDKVISGKEQFTEQEKRGYTLFQQHCFSCHTEPLFTSTQFASNGLPIDPDFNDLGRYSITSIGKDSLQFKVPTLRNVAFSFPYMHDGRFSKLRQVIDYYSDGIDTNNPYLSSTLRTPLHFTEMEKKDLLAFLYTLTDKDFLYDKRFYFQKK